MSIDRDTLLGNLGKSTTWLRVLLMIPFLLLMYVIIPPIVLAVAIAQTLFALVTGSPNDKLQPLAAGLNAYITQILRFLTYGSDEQPFPFSPFPASPASRAAAEGQPRAASREDDGEPPAAP